MHFFCNDFQGLLETSSCVDFTRWWQMKHRHRVHGLILISPICTAPCWTEWLYNKVFFSELLQYYDHFLVSGNLLINGLFYMQVMSNLLYFYGMCGVVKELLLKRYFSKVGLVKKQSLHLDIGCPVFEFVNP